MIVTNIYYLHEIGGKKSQEDYIWPLPGNANTNDRIFIVCDGVGGSENGEIASMLVAEFVGSKLSKTQHSNISAAYLEKILNGAKQNLIQYAATHGLNNDMATTFCLLVLMNDNALIAWCGDSRVYHIRHGEILYKTSDHSLVNTLLKNGDITEEEAFNHPQKNIILKAIKADDTAIEFEYHRIEEVKNGDYFLLCTDGLLENIDDVKLKTLLNDNDTRDTEVVNLFQQECYDRTRDNYSMYLVKVNQTAAMASSRRSKKYLVAGVIIFLIASAFIARSYFLSSKNIPPFSSVGTVTDTISAKEVKTVPKDQPKTDNKDSVGDFEIIKAEENTDHDDIEPASPAIIKPVKDSITPQKTDSGKDSLNKTNKAGKNPLPKTKKNDSSSKAPKVLK